MDPRFQTFSTVGLPGADELPRPLGAQTLILHGFPSYEQGVVLLTAFCTFVSPLYNIIHPVRQIALQS